MINLLEHHYKNNNIALIEENKEVKYKDLYNSVLIKSRNLEEKTIVFLIGNNTVNIISYYLSCLIKGAIPLLLPREIKKDKLLELIKKFKPSKIISDKNFEFNNNQFSEDNLFIYNNVFQKVSSTVKDALLLTTSGSTGNPKVVRISEKNLLSNTKSICNYLKIKDTDVHITTLPFNYTYGLSCINTHLYKGAKIILNNYSIIDKAFWEMVKINKPTTFSGVPYTYEVLFRLGLENLYLDSIINFTQAGGKLSNYYLKEFYNFCSKKNKKFFVMYGQTEATARMSFLPSEKLLEKLGSIGIAIPGGSFELANTNKYQSKNKYKVGELIYKGENVSIGYAEKIQDIKSKEEENTLNTGDLAYKDSDDYYYICGRINRFAKINGLRISLDDIQNLSCKFANSVAISDDLIILIIIEGLKSNENEKIIRKEIISNIKISPSIVKFKYLKEIPKNHSGKISYSDLKKFL